MELVKITEDLYLNSDFIASVEADGEKSTFITMINGGTCSPNIPIKKALDAICGSEEHLEKNEQIISEVINNLKKIDNISSVKIEYIRSDLGQPGGFLVQKN